jgi:beta-lactamase regulating signal transducer with metallopeptidase domain
MNTLNSASVTVLAAVLNTLWQAVAGTLVIWLALRYTRLRAAVRYAVWWGWLAVLLLLPAAPALLPRHNPQPSVQRAAVIPAARTAVTPLPVKFTLEPRTPLQVRVRRGPLVLLWLWLAMVLMQCARLVWSAIHLRSLKRDGREPSGQPRERFAALAAQCRISRRVRLLVSPQLTSPMAVGFVRPAVLLPEPLLARMGAVDLDHVLLHELAHLARRDDWTNLAARIAAAFLGWHPAAAWVLRRIDREREIACDEWVVAATGSPRPYAASLARLFELCWTRKREALAPGMAGSGSHLAERIEMLMRRRGMQRNSLLRVGLCVAALLALLVPAVQSPRWVAFAQESDAHRGQMHVPPPNPHSFLAALVAAGYGDLSVDDIIALKSHGLSPEYLRGMSQSGWEKLSAQKLIDLHSRGVDPEYAHAMKEAGFHDLNVLGVTDLRMHGVRPEYARQIHALGFGPYSPQQIIEFNAHGVPVELFRALQEAGFTRLTPQEIVEARNTGLQAGNLREAKQYGASLSLSQILRLKRAGVI